MKKLTLLMVTLAIPAIILGWLWQGYALSYAWNNIISAKFDIQTINTIHGMGLGLIASYMTKNIPNTSSSKHEEIAKNVAETIFRPLFLIIFTYGLVLFGI